MRRCELVEEPVGLRLHDHGAWAQEAPPDWLVRMIALSFGEVRGLALAGGDGHRGAR